MSEYDIKFSDISSLSERFEKQRQQTVDELNSFIAAMKDRHLVVVTLDELQSDHWDHEGETDYQDLYGQQVIRQVSDGDTEAVVITNIWGLPVALAKRDDDDGWQGISVVPPLREIIDQTLGEQLG